MDVSVTSDCILIGRRELLYSILLFCLVRAANVLPLYLLYRDVSSNLEIREEAVGLGQSDRTKYGIENR
jgi:hypothetical protein